MTVRPDLGAQRHVPDLADDPWIRILDDRFIALERHPACTGDDALIEPGSAYPRVHMIGRLRTRAAILHADPADSPAQTGKGDFRATGVGQ